jgi:hypothetical protein
MQPPDQKKHFGRGATRKKVAKPGLDADVHAQSCGARMFLLFY